MSFGSHVRLRGVDRAFGATAVEAFVVFKDGDGKVAEERC